MTMTSITLLDEWCATLDEGGGELLMQRHCLNQQQLSELLTYRVREGGADGQMS
jgi:hypothetical protein